MSPVNNFESRFINLSLGRPGGGSRSSTSSDDGKRGDPDSCADTAGDHDNVGCLIADGGQPTGETGWDNRSYQYYCSDEIPAESAGAGSPLAPDRWRSLPLTTRPELTQKFRRNELTNEDGTAVSWNKAISAFIGVVNAEARNGDDYDDWGGPNSTYGSRADGQYRKVLDFDRHSRRQFANCQVAHLRFRGSPVNADGDPLPVLDFYADLTASFSSIRSCLDNLLDGRRYRWAAVCDVTKNGVPHWHWLVYYESTDNQESLRAGDLDRVLEKHPKHSPVAHSDDHAHSQVESAWVKEHRGRGLVPLGKLDRERGTVTPVARYVAEQVPALGAKEGYPPENLEDGMTEMELAHAAAVRFASHMNPVRFGGESLPSA